MYGTKGWVTSKTKLSKIIKTIRVVNDKRSMEKSLRHTLHSQGGYVASPSVDLFLGKSHNYGLKQVKSWQLKYLG